MGKTVKTNIYANTLNIPKDKLWQKRVYKKDDMKEYRNFCRLINQLLYVKKGTDTFTRRYGGRFTFSSQQNCVVKARIGKDESAHRKFIKEYLPQENKTKVLEKPELFSAEKDKEECINEYMRNMTGKHFKFIISPENGRVDCRALVKTLVKRMEKITGYSYQWLAAIHTDTNHPHAHLLINGEDKNRKDIWFDKIFITQTMREMTRQICTEMIGRRSREEINASALQSYLSNRYCPYDSALKSIEEPLVDTTGVGSLFQSQVRTTNESLHKRLVHLTEIGLAKQKDGSRYIYLLEKDWIGKLRAIGRYNSFLQARSELQVSHPVNMELYTQETGTISGTITQLYKMNDEDSWNHAILVENQMNGKAWYVPLYYEPDDSLLRAEITCNLSKNQKGLLVPHIKVINRYEQDRQKN